MIHRRKFIGRLTSLVAIAPLVSFAETSGPLVQVYKSRTCGCCSKWVDHLREAGFKVEATNVADVGVYKREYGLPAELASCHTAMVEGYIVEGHVPADDVIRMLKLKPEIKGIAVPGMPMGSPGMESPNPDNYETLAFAADGTLSVWAKHGPGS
jgi:hypothetical protein